MPSPPDRFHEAAYLNDLQDKEAGMLPRARISGLENVIDRVQAEHRLEILSDLLDRYPDQLRKIKAIVFVRQMLDPDDLAYWDKTKLILSASPYTASDWAELRDAGFFHAGRDVDRGTYLIAHEFGHVLAENRRIVSPARRIVEDAVGIAGPRTLNVAGELGLISKYAARQYAEAVAEAFATMTLSPDMASRVERDLFTLLTGKGGR
jgi:hypothetical protein